MHCNHGFKQHFTVVIIGSCIILEVMRSLQKLHYRMQGTKLTSWSVYAQCRKRYICREAGWGLKEAGWKHD